MSHCAECGFNCGLRTFIEANPAPICFSDDGEVLLSQV